MASIYVRSGGLRKRLIPNPNWATASQKPTSSASTSLCESGALFTRQRARSVATMKFANPHRTFTNGRDFCPKGLRATTLDMPQMKCGMPLPSSAPMMKNQNIDRVVT